MTTSKNVRKIKRLVDLGTANPRCQICGETEITLLEKHHIAGCHEGETIIVCRGYCHPRLTDKQLDWPKEILSRNRLSEMKLVAKFRGLGDIYSLRSDFYIKQSEKLYDLIMQEQNVSYITLEKESWIGEYQEYSPHQQQKKKA